MKKDMQVLASSFYRFVSLLLLAMGMLVAMPVNASGTADLMLVLDESGSMIGTYGSDPNNVRYTAVQQLMSSIANGSVIQNAGLVYFSSTANLTVPLSPISTASTSIAAVATPTGAGSLSNGTTNTASAIQIAADAFAHSSASKKVMVVFTDGGADDPTAAAAAAAAAAQRGITVNIIALGSSAAAYSEPVAKAGNGVVLTATDVQQLLSLFGSSIGVSIVSAPEVIKAQTAAVSAQVQRATTIQQAVTIINVLSSIANPRAAMGPQRFALGAKKGMAAGETASQWNAWMNLSRAQIANTFTSTTADTRFDGDVDNWIGGIDYGIDKNLVVGASIGYDKTNLDTHYNKGNFSSEGLMIAPYISYQINPMFSVDAVIGYADGDSDLRSNIFGLVFAKQDFTRNFAAVNLSAVQWFDSWQVTGKMSYITAEEKLKGYTDSANTFTQGQDNRLEQFRLGAQVGYWANGILPYIGLTYINDVNAPSSGILGTSSNRDAYTAVFGINVFSKDLMGSLSYTTERNRSSSKNNILMASISYRF